MTIFRLADQVQSQFTTNNQHFEDLNLGENRPTELVRQYGNLYSDARMDAIDALDSIEELGELSLLKEKILFSVVVVRVNIQYNQVMNIYRILPNGTYKVVVMNYEAKIFGV